MTAYEKLCKIDKEKKGLLLSMEDLLTRKYQKNGTGGNSLFWHEPVEHYPGPAEKPLKEEAPLHIFIGLARKPGTDELQCVSNGSRGQIDPS